MHAAWPTGVGPDSPLPPDLRAFPTLQSSVIGPYPWTSYGTANVTVTANLPGVNLEDIDVTIEGGVLTIKAEPRYENGVLSITLPVAESKKAKHLTVAVGAALPGGQ